MTEQTSFLGNTQNILVGTLLSLTRYEISDRNMRGGAAWIAIPNSGDNANVMGLELLKIAMPYAMFDQQLSKEQAGEYTLPAEFEILTEMRMGGQNKPTLTIKALRPVDKKQPATQVVNDLAAKPNSDKPTQTNTQTTGATTHPTLSPTKP